MKLPAPAAALALIAASPAALALPGEEHLFQEGLRLPELELPTIDGARTLRLAELTGKRTLLIQFASW